MSEKARELGDVEAFVAAVEVVGSVQRVMELVGWCVCYTLLEGGDAKKARERLQRAGLSRATAYRALEDLRRIGERWNRMEQTEARPWIESVARLGSLNLKSLV